MAGNSHRFEGAVCIRPSYVWPWTSFHSSSQQARCMEEGFVRIGKVLGLAVLVDLSTICLCSHGTHHLENTSTRYDNMLWATGWC